VACLENRYRFNFLFTKAIHRSYPSCQLFQGAGVQGICQADSGGRIADSGQAAKKKRGAWQNHTRLSHNAINSYYTSLDHLLLGKAADNPIIKPLDPNSQWAFFGCRGT
jgi:hypothetical protein